MYHHEDREEHEERSFDNPLQGAIGRAMDVPRRFGQGFWGCHFNGA